MLWDFRDRLVMTRRQAVDADDDDGQQRQGERTYYVYDASGQRVRKVTELADGRLKDERVYLGAYELYRRYDGNPVVRETLPVSDGTQQFASVETRVEGDEPRVPQQLVRYQFGNHLGSAVLELDGGGDIISYEEYYPYGCTSYQAVRNQRETPNRYRYTGKERDEESGLYYHGARYYAPWLCRWTSADPLGLVGGINLYRFAAANPIRFTDPTGYQPRVLALGRRTIEHPLTGEQIPHTPQVVQNAANNPYLDPRTTVVTFNDLLQRRGEVLDEWRRVVGQGLPPGSTGLQSGELLQRFLEGVTTIHFTTTGVDVFADTHTSAELRGVIAYLSEGRNLDQDVFFQEGANVSRIPAGTSIVEGAELPERIAAHLPPSFRLPPRPLPPTTPRTPPTNRPPPQSPPPAGRQLSGVASDTAAEVAEEVTESAGRRLATGLGRLAGRAARIVPFLGFGATLLTFDPNDLYNLSDNALGEAILGEHPLALIRDVAAAHSAVVNLLSIAIEPIVQAGLENQFVVSY
jgi:RHS repeat-associated protein